MAELQFRVSARTRSRSEYDQAVKILSQIKPDEVHSYDGLVTGLANREVVQELIKSGLLVDLSSDIVKAKPLARYFLFATKAIRVGRDALAVIREKAVAGGVPGVLTTLPGSTPSGGPVRAVSQVYDVRLVGPMRPAWADFFKSSAIKIFSYAPRFKYRMPLDQEQRRRLSQQDFFVSLERYSLRDTVTGEFVRVTTASEPAVSEEYRTFDLMTHSEEAAALIAEVIRASEAGSVLEASGRYIRFQALPGKGLAEALATRTEVKSITPYVPAQLFCEFGSTVIGVTQLRQSVASFGDGAGEIVGVLDSGVDKNHPDLASRIHSYEILPNATKDDSFGHGTHVAGIIAGTGVASPSHRTGVAPGAELAVVAICDAQNVPQLPPDMGTLLERAANQGAKIINLSLGFPSNQYDQYAESIDEFVCKNPEILVVIASGNRGSAKTGFPDFNSLTTPATAKNAVTVGACISNRPGFATTWKDYNAALFATSPVSEMKMTGPPVVPAGLSSRGPSDYSSIKPDLVAPGTYVLSAKAANGSLASYAAVDPAEGPYIFLNGTSMAAPFVSGAAALLRQYLRTQMGTGSPSAALLKALLCCSAVRCASVMSAAVEPSVGYPDFDQGAGCMNLSTILPHTGSEGLRLAFRDIANGSEEAMQSRASVGSARRSNRIYKIAVSAAGLPFRVLLAWTDTPSRFLQNTLQLDVQGPNVHLIGNHEHMYGKSPLFQTLGVPGIPFDTVNNVQVVNLKNAAVGEYVINVVADNTPDPNHYQGFALVVSGRLSGDLGEEAPLF